MIHITNVNDLVFVELLKHLLVPFLALDFCWETSSLSDPIFEREPDTDAATEKGNSQAATGNREVVLQRTATRVAQIVGHITMQCIPYDFTTTHRGVRRPDET